jgi:hypothetical protein
MQQASSPRMPLGARQVFPLRCLAAPEPWGRGARSKMSIKETTGVEDIS